MIPFVPAQQQCSPNQFDCGDRTCIDVTRRCDNYRDCEDGRDEINCTGKLTPLLVNFCILFVNLTPFQAGDIKLKLLFSL